MSAVDNVIYAAYKIDNIKHGMPRRQVPRASPPRSSEHMSRLTYALQ